MLKERILNLVDPFIRLPVIGLDISDLTVKYLKFGSRGSLTFDFWGEINIPEGIIADGEIKREDDLVEILSSWLAKDGKRLRSSFVAASLPEEKSFVRVIQLPKMEREAVGNAIRWEIEANIPLSPEELLYDYEIIEPLEDHLDHFDVVITAFPKSSVESYVRSLKRSGLNPVALELESQVIVRAVLKNLREAAAKIIIDLGRNRTSFIIFAGGAIIFTTTVRVGGRVFEENIAKVPGISSGEALAVKKEVGLNRGAYDGKIFSALAPSLGILAEELGRAVEYYRNYARHKHGAGETIDEVLLVGGDANLFGLDTYLASALKIPVRHADPLAVVKERLASPFPPFLKSESLAYATALGLALRGLR